MIFIHPSAEVDKTAKIGKNSKIWHQAQIRESVVLGRNCVIGKSVYIDHHVVIGDNCKIQNQVSIYHGVKIEKGVFIGPHVCFTNDKMPRAVRVDGKPKTTDDWKESKILVKEGASIGASSVIAPGIIIGKWAMVGAGSVVTRNIPDHGLVYGNPAKLKGYVCFCGRRLTERKGAYICPMCSYKLTV